MSSFLPIALDYRSLVFRNRGAQAACFSDIAAGVRLVNHALDKGEKKSPEHVKKSTRKSQHESGSWHRLYATSLAAG
jgi:hypothetical protein